MRRTRIAKGIKVSTADEEGGENGAFMLAFLGRKMGYAVAEAERVLPEVSAPPSSWKNLLIRMVAVSFNFILLKSRLEGERFRTRGCNLSSTM